MSQLSTDKDMVVVLTSTGPGSNAIDLATAAEPAVAGRGRGFDEHRTGDRHLEPAKRASSALV